jgi:hypothetical protein
MIQAFGTRLFSIALIGTIIALGLFFAKGPLASAPELAEVESGGVQRAILQDLGMT